MSSRLVSQQPSRKNPVMGFIEQTSSRSPRTFRGPLGRPPPFPLSSLNILRLPHRGQTPNAGNRQQSPGCTPEYVGKKIEAKEAAIRPARRRITAVSRSSPASGVYTRSPAALIAASTRRKRPRCCAAAGAAAGSSHSLSSAGVRPKVATSVRCRRAHPGRRPFVSL
jgi:hypothetical protein